MKTYVLLIKGALGWPRWHCTMQALDDREAIDNARNKVTGGHTFGQAVELWQEKVLIATIEPFTSASVHVP